jgi:hypothetical protein
VSDWGSGNSSVRLAGEKEPLIRVAFGALIIADQRDNVSANHGYF